MCYPLPLSLPPAKNCAGQILPSGGGDAYGANPAGNRNSSGCWHSGGSHCAALAVNEFAALSYELKAAIKILL